MRSDGSRHQAFTYTHSKGTCDQFHDHKASVGRSLTPDLLYSCMLQRFIDPAKWLQSLFDPVGKRLVVLRLAGRHNQ